MDDSDLKVRKQVSKQVQAIRDLTDVLSKCISKRLDMAAKKHKDRIKIHLDHVKIYRSFLEQTKDRVSGCHLRWFYGQIYEVCYDKIPLITDEAVHGDPKHDFMLDNQLVLWIGKGTDQQQKNYRMAIGIIYNYAMQASNRCVKNCADDEEIDYKLQLDYLTPWEIKYHLMNVLCYAIEDKDPDDRDLIEMREMTEKLKFLANLTEEQAKENAKKTMTGFAKGATDMIKSMGIKDKDGNPISGFDNADGLTDVMSSLMSQDVGAAISEAFAGGSDADPFDTLVEKVVPVVKRSMKKIPRPEGVKDNKDDEPKDIIDTLCSEKGKKNIKKGIASIQKAFTNNESSSEEESG